jgi:signal transduction histidine kinase
MGNKENWLPAMQASLRKGKTVINGGEHSVDNGAEKAQAPADRQHKPELAVPIRLADEMLGVFGFAGDEDVLWAEEEISAVEAVVEQVGLALEKQRLYEQTQRAAEELAVLNEMARELAAELSVDQIIAITYRYIKRLLRTSETYIALYDDTTDEVDVRILGEEEEIVESALRRKGGKGITELIIRKGEPLLLPVVTDSTPEEYGYEFIGRMARSWLGVPMIMGDRCLGVIAVQDFEQQYRFNNHDQDLLTAIAGQAAISIQNANLFAQNQQALAETQTLYDISARLNSALRLQDILLAAISPARSAGAASAGLWIFENNEQNLPEWQELVAIWGNIETNVLNQAVRMRIGEMPLAHAWGSRETEPVFIADVHNSKRVDDHARAIFNVLGTSASCALPLITGARQIGMITISWSEPRVFDQTEKRLYRNIAAQTAEVVEGRLLFRAARERTIQLELLSRIEAALSQAADEAGLLRAIVTHLEDINNVKLFYVNSDADHQPESIYQVSEWTEQEARPVSGKPQALQNDPLAPLWLDNPHDIRAISDVRRDLTLADEQRENLLAQNIRAIVFVPYYRGARWQGVMLFTWSHTFTLSSIHRFVLRRLLEPVGASLASRRAHLAQQEALAETAMLYQAIAALNAAQSYSEVLAVLDQFSTLGRESAVMVYHRFDRPWTKTQNPEWFDVPARLAKVDTLPLAPRYRFTDSPAAKQLRPDRPVWIENITTDTRLDETTRANLTGRTQMKSVIFVPLAYGGQWIGNLGAFYAEPRRFSADAVRQFTGLCTQAAIAIQNLRLVEAAQQRARREQLLRRVTERVRNATELRVIPQIASQSLERFLHRPVRISLDMVASGENGSASASAEGNHHDVFTDWLFSRGARIGQITVENDPNNPLTEDEVSLIQAVTRQASAALENLTLLAETRKRAVELETVSQVGTATSTILESERLLKSVVDLTRQSFNLYHVQIFLIDDERDQLRLVAGSGAVGDRMKNQNWRVRLDHDGLLTQVVRSRTGIVVDDIRQEAYYQPNPILPDTRAELALPMIAGNNLMGVFDVQADRPGFFSDADIVIQNALATQVAVALQNAILYEEQIQTAEKLREVERLKSEFLASMSHELRTPLNSIIGFADVLLEGLDGELNPRMREDVQLIRDSGQYLRELIGDILDMSKIEAGKMKLRYELIDVPELANEILANARTIAVGFRKEHLNIHAEVTPNVNTVYADRTRLKQVIYNLMSNAIKFTETGRIRLSMRYEANWFLTSVSDTGIGIKDEDLHLIFEQFRQVDNTLTGVAGTGLGLPISKSLIELHGGQLYVQSASGQGTKFWFKIPRYGAGELAPESASPQG